MGEVEQPVRAAEPVMPPNHSLQDLLSSVPDAEGELQERLPGLAKLAKAVKREDLSRRLLAESQRLGLPQPAAVVVAGETKRGKSSLVNVLIRAPGLLPVDTDVATGVHVVIRYGPELSAHVFLAEAESGTSIDLDDISAYVSVVGNPDNAKRVRFVDVSVPAPLLAQGLVILDTPGVNGLDAAHGRVTLAALSRADALIMVLDSSAPISRPELEFLARASERIDKVILLLTKVDSHPQWRTVLEENLKLLREKAPRFANNLIHPVSSRLAAAALSSTDATTGDKLWERSGYAELEQRLVGDVASGRRRLRAANACRLSEFAIGEIDGWYARLQATLSGDAGPGQRLVEEESRLRELTRSLQTWRASLQDDIARLERRLGIQLQESVACLRTRMEKEVTDHWSPGLRDKLPSEVETELKALETDLGRSVTEGISDVANERARLLGLDSVALEYAGYTVAAPEASEVAPAALDAAAKARLARQLVYAGGGGGVGVIVAAALPTIPLLPLLLPAILTAAFASLDITSMKKAREQQEARRVLSDCFGRWQRDASYALSDAIRDGRQRIDDRISAALETRLHEVQEQVKVLTGEAQKASQRQKLLTQAAEAREALAVSRASVGRIRERLATDKTGPAAAADSTGTTPTNAGHVAEPERTAASWA